MRTPSEIKEELLVQRSQPSGGFGGGFGNEFWTEVCCRYLSYDDIQAFYRTAEKDPTSGLTRAVWEDHQHELSDAVVLSDMRTYMAEYGWPKAVGHRGISASRTVTKMDAWAWLLGRDDVRAAMAQAPYAMYGAPKLLRVCTLLGFPIPTGGDDAKIASAMAAGQPCPECLAGNSSGCLAR